MNTRAAFTRLQAANPCPSSSPLDAELLFDRITGSAPATQVVSTRGRARRPLLVFALALATAAVLVSTALGLAGWIGSVIGPAEANSEFMQAQSQLTLPPGFSWPQFSLPPNSVTSRGAGGAAAVMMAQVAWECYWARAIHAGDTTAAHGAHAALSDLMTNHIVVAPTGAPEDWSPPQAARTPTATFADDGGYEFKQRMYERASSGNPGLPEQSCSANAPTDSGWR